MEYFSENVDYIQLKMPRKIVVLKLIVLIETKIGIFSPNFAEYFFIFID